MGENLSKRGFQGPFRCALCLKNLEMSHHLFLECEFSKQVWKLVYSKLFHKVVWPQLLKPCWESGGNSIRDLFMVNLCFKERGGCPLNMCVGNYGLQEIESFSKISTPILAL
jgi:hypothetical protein